ncbi:MAG: hypothetical protein ACJAV2_003871, partial [Myxococcota bacterium]
MMDDFPANLDLYIDRAVGLAQIIRDALATGETTDLTHIQADALASAVGHVLRHRDALGGQDEPFPSMSKLV